MRSQAKNFTLWVCGVCVWGGGGGELVKILDFAARELDMMSRVFVRWVSWSIVLRS